MNKENDMFKKLRSITILAAIVASLVLGSTTAQAGAPAKGDPLPGATPANISWE